MAAWIRQTARHVVRPVVRQVVRPQLQWKSTVAVVDDWLDAKVKKATRDESEATELLAALKSPEIGVKDAADLELLTEADLQGKVPAVVARKFLAKAPVPPEFFPPGAMQALEDKGVMHAHTAPDLQLWGTSFLAGAQLAFGSSLMCVVAGGAAGALDPGSLALLKGLVFPVGLSYIVLSGSDLVTGTYLYQTMAGPIAGRVGALDSARVIATHFSGNLLGSLVMVGAVASTGILGPLGGAMAAKTAAAKCGGALVPTFLKAIGANWLVATAIYQATTAKTTAGKIVALWFPITTFIVLGLEHSVANMFLLPVGMLNGADIDSIAIMKNIAIVSVGNALGAGLFVGTIQRFNIFGALNRTIK